MRIKTVCAILMLTTSAYASIPYCPGTVIENRSKSDALQYVVRAFASKYGYSIGDNCLLQVDGSAYSIAWQAPSNDWIVSVGGSVFICDHGKCNPKGFNMPRADYQGK